MKICHFILTFLFLLSSCSTTSTSFHGLSENQANPHEKNIKREISSENPINKGCHQILEEFLYLKEQKEYKEAQKKKKK